MQDVYMKPYGRGPPYFYGLFLGIMYVQFLKVQKQSISHQQGEETSFLLTLKNKFEDKVWFRRCFELSGVALGMFLVLIPRTAQGEDRHWPQLAHSLFLTYGKWAFTFAISLIILPSLLGIKSIVRFMLDTKFFNYIAKVSFCTYLVHLIMLDISFQNTTTDYYYSVIPHYSLFVSMTAISLGLGFLMAVLVELPLSRLQRILMQSLMKKNEKKQLKEEDSKPEQPTSQQK